MQTLSVKPAKNKMLIWASLTLVLGILMYYLVLSDSNPSDATAPVKNQRSENIQDRFNTMAAQLTEWQKGADAADKKPAPYALLNPAEYALTARDYGGHPAYGSAMLANVCANHFESRGNHDQDMADAARLQRSGSQEFANLVEETAFKIRTMEVQCQGVTARDIKNAGALMREAAAAGDINAKGVVLLEDFRAADSERRDAKQAGRAYETSPAVYKSWLSDATKLAEQGNQDAARLAALMTSVSSYGQQDAATSAMWTMVSQQSKGEAFDPSRFSFDTEPYNTMSNAEKTAAIQRAQVAYTACCSKPAVQ